MKTTLYAIAASLSVAVLLAGGCTGRTADNMKPLGETVEVVVPTADVAEDSALAAPTEVETPVNE